MTDVIEAMFNLQRQYLEYVREHLGSESAHPRQGPILQLLMTMDGVSQADLMRKLGVSAATVAVSIARLERLGYVKRERNQRNQRANILALTAEGRQQAQRLQVAMIQACDTALRGLTEDDRNHFINITARMAENLRRYGGSTAAGDHDTVPSITSSRTEPTPSGTV